ncbi:uncharacterized protein DS421_17g572590 [Arachis hypogaea]|nr:uncharacterized protein DS421_17g572590 [Arachis hypogaea]
MIEEKKAIVRESRFGGLMHIPPMNIPHKLLKELANSFNLDKNKLETSHGSFKVKPKIIGAALGLNASVSFKDLSEENKVIFRRFQEKTLKNLTDEMMNIGVGNNQDRLMFKRIFIFYIQMTFLLPTTINKVSPIHLAPIFRMDNITEGNWGTHGIIKKAEVKKKLKEMKEKGKKEKKKKTKRKKASSSESDSSESELDFSSESESEQDSEETTERRKQPTRTAKKKRKQILEDSTSESESESVKVESDNE